jgi:glycolate oxidase FAD binding subunit
MTSPLESFAAAVGPAPGGPVTCVGGRTQWSVGGELDRPAREVSAPAGVVAHEPGEMIVRARAGTTLAELAEATAVGGQFVAVEAEDPARATVGGVLACGRSGVRQLGRGPARDTVLEVTAVTAAGELIRAGAPLVKNVTGFDLCRLLVGSVGTLAFLGEVVLRCHPLPEAEAWWRSDPERGADPFSLLAALYRPLSVLWDGRSVWVGLAGRRVDVEEQSATVLGRLGGFTRVDGPPAVPAAARRSVPAGSLRSLPAALLPALPAAADSGSWVVEVGVGVVHCDSSVAAWLPPRPAEAGVVELHRRIKDRFDPTGRLNPGRSPLTAPAGRGATDPARGAA